MNIKKLNEELEKFIENVDEQAILDSFEAATEDSNMWAYGWCDIESLFRYAQAAGKPFNASEKEVVKVLKEKTDDIKEITQEAVDDFIENEEIEDPDIIDELNYWAGADIYIGWGDIQDALKDLTEI